jgi:hypothetical protein
VLLNLLKLKAVEKDLLEPNVKINLEVAFTLVRDMPYVRASSRDPETIIREWRGTCSGKHYLLKALFAELGYQSRLIACTAVAEIDPQTVSGKLRAILEQSNGRFVDVHNYLILELPEGEMIMDATWPISTEGTGTVVNKSFQLYVDQQIACEPLIRFEVPEDQNPQAFKEQLLKENFSPKELADRDKFINALGELSIKAHS